MEPSTSEQRLRSERNRQIAFDRLHLGNPRARRRLFYDPGVYPSPPDFKLSQNFPPPSPSSSPFQLTAESQGYDASIESLGDSTPPEDCFDGDHIETQDFGHTDLSEQQRKALIAIKAGKSVFVTGSAGTGKTHLLKEAVRVLRERHGPGVVFVTASTGLAACNLGGTTIHSFAGVGIGYKRKDKLALMVDSNKSSKERWKRAKVLIIDEISMIDGVLFDKLDYVGRFVRRKKDKGDGFLFDAPFGGLQLIVTGDFFQLPPVKMVRFAFQADCWNRCFDLQIVLTEVFRQQNGHFIEMLNEIRVGKCSESTLKSLQACMNRNAQDFMGIIPTMLYPLRRDVREKNDVQFEKLNCPDIVTYISIDEVEPIEKKKSEEFWESNFMAPKNLILGKGAQVMLIKNLDTAAGLVNGARGVVVDFLWREETPPPSPERGSKEKPPRVKVRPNCYGWPVVQFFCGVKKAISPKTWTMSEGLCWKARRTQIPLILSWSLSVHKCQGLSLDYVKTDLSRVFEDGMVYVALSRVRTLNGLILRGFDPSKIRVNPLVVDFYNQLSAQSS